MDYIQPGSSVHWILQATVLEWVAIYWMVRIPNYIHSFTWENDQVTPPCIVTVLPQRVIDQEESHIYPSDLDFGMHTGGGQHLRWPAPIPTFWCNPLHSGVTQKWLPR